jgi:hypothetical protein
MKGNRTQLNNQTFQMCGPLTLVPRNFQPSENICRHYTPLFRNLDSNNSQEQRMFELEHGETRQEIQLLYKEFNSDYSNSIDVNRSMERLNRDSTRSIIVAWM